MGLSCTVSEIDSDLSRKSQIFLLHVFYAPNDGVPLRIGYRHMESKTLE